MLEWLTSMTHVHLCADRLIASCNAEWKWVQRLLSGEPLTMVVAVYSSHVTYIDRVTACCCSPPPSIFNAMQRDDETAITPNDVRMQQQQQRSSIPSFLFIVFMLFMLTNHSGDEYLARSQYQDTLQAMNDQLSNFTAWMNGESSNFTMVGVCACCVL